MNVKCGDLTPDFGDLTPDFDCQSRKPKGCENGKRRAKLGNKLGKGNIHQSFSTSC